MSAAAARNTAERTPPRRGPSGMFGLRPYRNMRRRLLQDPRISAPVAARCRASHRRSISWAGIAFSMFRLENAPAAGSRHGGAGSISGRSGSWPPGPQFGRKRCDSGPSAIPAADAAGRPVERSFDNGARAAEPRVPPPESPGIVPPARRLTPEGTTACGNNPPHRGQARQRTGPALAGLPLYRELARLPAAFAVARNRHAETPL